MPPPKPSKLDFEQVLPAAFDDASGSLRTTATLVASGETQVIITQEDDSIRIGDGVNLITATIVGPDVGLDVNVIGGTLTGEFQFSGLSTGLDTQAVFVSDVAVKVPAVPLVNRNGLSVRVLTQNITVYFGNSGVTPVNGYPKFYREEIILDIKDNTAVDLWAVCDTGVTGQLRIIELA